MFYFTNIYFLDPDPLNTVLLDDTLKNIESTEIDTVKETIKPLYEATFDEKTIGMYVSPVLLNIV